MTESELLLLWDASTPAVTLPRLVRDGHVFVLDTYEPFTAIECTDFQLLQRHLNGEDIRPVLAQRRDCGYNMVRVLGMCAGMFWLKPQAEPDYWRGLRSFCALAAQHGLYVEFTAFADATVIMPSAASQIAYWSLVGTLADVTNLIVEAVNEADQPINYLASLQNLWPLTGLLCSHGSNGSEQLPVRPWWDYETAHFNEAHISEWHRKPSHNGMEYSQGDAEGHIAPSRKPIIANENKRYPDRVQSLTQAYDCAAACALLIAGSCFHSVNGKSSTLWTGIELAAAKAWAAGARSVDLAAQDGPYRHRRELENRPELPGYDPASPTYLRVYERPVAGHDTIVKIRY